MIAWMSRSDSHPLGDWDRDQYCDRNQHSNEYGDRYEHAHRCWGFRNDDANLNRGQECDAGSVRRRDDVLGSAAPQHGKRK